MWRLALILLLMVAGAFWLGCVLVLFWLVGVI